MYFMRATNAFGVPIIGISKKLKTLMNKDIVNHKIGEAVSKDTKTNWQAYPNIFVLPQEKTSYTYKRIKDEEKIIALPPRAVIFMMMIAVQYP